MSENIQYYLIHGIDESRKPRMIEEFKKANIDNSKVKWMEYPNKDDITNELRLQLLDQNPSYTWKYYVQAGCPNLNNAVVSCTYKHYLSLKDIVENKYEYSVIMEDNIYFSGNVPERLKIVISQLNEMYPDWDVIFDSNWCKYNQGEIKDNIFVYPVNNEYGGTRCAHFYLMNYKCAKKLYDNYIPFNNAPDWWMNDLFRKVDIKSFWMEPNIVHIFPHKSTVF